MTLFSLKPSLMRLIALFFLLLNLTAFAQAQTVADISRNIKNNHLAQALEQAEALIAKNPKDAQGYFMKGIIFAEQGKSAEAIGVFTKLTEDFPELPEPYNNLAVLYAQQKDYNKAKNALEMAIRTHPSYATAHENLGDVYAKLASQSYSKALQLDASNSSSQKLLMISSLIEGSGKVKPAPSAINEPIKVAQNDTPKTKTAEVKAAELKPESKPESKPDSQGTILKPEKPSKAEIKPEPKAEPKNTGNAAEEVQKTLLAWADAWSKKNVKGYLAFYAPNFKVPNKQSRAAWEKERTARIDKPGKLNVQLSDIRVSINTDQTSASARFRQEYTSSTLASNAGKTALLVKNGGKWMIVEERVN